MRRLLLPLLGTLLLTLVPLVPELLPFAGAADRAATRRTMAPPMPAPTSATPPGPNGAVAVPPTPMTLPPSAPAPLPAGVPAATLHLTRPEALKALNAQWRYSDTRVVETAFRSVGSDNKPSGRPNHTYDIEPHAEGVDFDDSAWPVLDPTSLDARRSTGKVCFNWYRLRMTVPAQIGGLSTAGATLVFAATVDDYAEIWVDGRLDRALGQTGGGVVAGWNVPNRVVITRDARPGQVIQLAIFGINGPISVAPENYVWIRDARLDLFNVPRAVAGRPVPLQVERLDPALDALLPAGAQLEQVAEGFRFTEGPIWQRAGFLLFSDPNANTIYRWHPTEGLSVFRTPSGYSGADIAEYGQPGSNGLTLDEQGRLTLCEHGNHRIARLERDGSETPLVDLYEGRRLNSPNDLVYRSDGTLYFTDPPFGLPKFFDDPRKELPFSGVFCWRDGHLNLVNRELTGPNGLAFSPDEKFLYVTNWDTSKKVVMRYPVRPDGSLAEGRVFFDMTNAPGEEALDGIKVDRRGNLYVSGPGGLWILSAEGKHLGTLKGPELAANFAWGDEDGRTLYLTARTGVYRLRLSVPGAGAVVNYSQNLR